MLTYADVKTRFRYREIQEAAAQKRKGLPDISPQDLAAKKDTNNTPRECGPSGVDGGSSASSAVQAGSFEAPPDVDGVRVMPLLAGSVGSLAGAAASAEGAEGAVQDAGDAAAAYVSRRQHTSAYASAEGAEQDAGDAAAAGEHPQALRSEGEHPQALRSRRITGGREAGPHEESHADAGYGDVGDVGDVDDRRVLAARDLAGEDDQSDEESAAEAQARVAAGFASAVPAGIFSAGRALAC
jgi:hypothetical protein